MLVLTRKKDQAIMVGDNIEITILEVKGDSVKIGVSAPREITVFRKEIYLEIKEENKAAVEHARRDLSGIAAMIKKQIDIQGAENGRKEE